MAGSLADAARWTGATDGVLSTAGNWTAIAGTPSTPPTSGEAAVHDGDYNVNITSGTLTGLGSININGWRGNLGAPGSAITYSATTVGVNSFGLLYWTCTATSFHANATNGGKLWLTGGTITNLLKSAAAVVDIGASCVVTNFAGNGNGLTVADNATGFTLFEQDGGVATVDRAITTAHVTNNGRLILTGIGNTITTARTGSGGVIDFRGGGTITTLVNLGGFTAENLSMPLTITNLYGPRTAPFTARSKSGILVSVTNDFRGGTGFDAGGSGGLGA